MSVAYIAILPLPESTVAHVAGLLAARRQALGTRWRALTCLEQAVLGLRWFTDGTRVEQLALDNAIGRTTAYDSLHEVIDTLAARAPALHNVLLAAKVAGHQHISVDGTLIHTDRVGQAGPATAKATSVPRRVKVDLWWSGKHGRHGGNIQVVTAPDGWPMWTSEVRPGREHDVTALRAHPEMLPALTDWTGENLPVLGDLGYLGEATTITVAVKKPKGGQLTDEQKTANKAHNQVRAVGERGNALLKWFKALRRVSLCPCRIGAIAAAALVLLHLQHGRSV
ncbi:IS5/IS1182 family transposase [Nocardia sp. NBC_01377]|uniref:transposase family protein n=1 Tax=Nocardia sp. NBC_01377 TaxID=2903595 RepID=UPI003253FFA3